MEPLFSRHSLPGFLHCLYNEQVPPKFPSPRHPTLTMHLVTGDTWRVINNVKYLGVQHSFAKNIFIKCQPVPGIILGAREIQKPYPRELSASIDRGTGNLKTLFCGFRRLWPRRILRGASDGLTVHHRCLRDTRHRPEWNHTLGPPLPSQSPVTEQSAPGQWGSTLLQVHNNVAM